MFQVRQLIGHFNVCFNQLKNAKETYRVRMKEETQRKDEEIARLREENGRVLQLQDDLQEKDEQIERLKSELDELRRESEQMQSQTDEISSMFDQVSHQVRYLEGELAKTRTQSTHDLEQLLREQMAKSKSKGKSSKPLAPVIGDDSSDEDEDEEEEELKDDDDDGAAEEVTPEFLAERSGVHGKSLSSSAAAAPRPSVMWRTEMAVGDRCDVCDESGLWWTGTCVKSKDDGGLVELRYDQWGGTEWFATDSHRLAPLGSRYYAKIGSKKILKEGHMSKEGKMFRTWRRRYFVLFDNGTMNYYHDKGHEDDPISSFTVLGMKGTKVTSFGRGAKKQPGFQLHTDDRMWKFVCDSEQDALEWIRVINLLNDGAYSE